MKKLFITAMITMAAIASPAFAESDKPQTRKQIVGISDAYIPSGFDTGSDAFVVINGLFPNSCYRMDEARVNHIGAALHEVSAFADVTEGMCLMVLVPYNREVALGKLQAGDHAVRFINGDGTHWEKRFSVEN